MLRKIAVPAIVIVAVAITLYLVALPPVIPSRSGNRTLPSPTAMNYPRVPELIFPKTSLNKPPAALSSLRGHVVLLDFWATWCGPCKLSIPELVSLYKKYHSQGLDVIGVSADSGLTRDQVPSVMKELGMTYPVAFEDDIANFTERLPQESQPSGLPTLLLIDRKGQIRKTVTGYDPTGSMEPEVTDLLKEQG